MSVMLVSSMTLSSGAIVAQAYNGTSAITERTMTNEQLVAATTPILQSYTKDASDKTWVMTKDSKFVIVANEANLKNERLAEIVKLVNSEFMAKQIVSSDAQAMLYNQTEHQLISLLILSLYQKLLIRLQVKKLIRLQLMTLVSI